MFLVEVHKGLDDAIVPKSGKSGWDIETRLE